MSTKKNPAAVALGRKGGKVKNPRKGFGASSEKARLAALKRWGKATEPSSASSVRIPDVEPPPS